MTTVYITKYALTEGILVEQTDCRVDLPVIRPVGNRRYVTKPHWHTDPTEAVAQAERMRLQKIESLRGWLARLEKMTFEVPE